MASRRVHIILLALAFVAAFLVFTWFPSSSRSLESRPPVESPAAEGGPTAARGNLAVPTSAATPVQITGSSTATHTTMLPIVRTSSTATPTVAWWKPTPDQPIHWHWQLSENFVYPRDVLPNVTVYDVDGELTSAETVAQLHAMNPNVKV